MACIWLMNRGWGWFIIVDPIFSLTAPLVCYQFYINCPTRESPKQSLINESLCRNATQRQQNPVLEFWTLSHWGAIPVITRRFGAAIPPRNWALEKVVFHAVLQVRPCIIFSFCLRNSRGNWNQPFQSSSINMFFSEAIPRWNPTDMRFPHHGTTPQKSGRMDADCNILTHSPGSFPDISRSKGSQIYHPTSSWWSATPPWDIRDRYHAPPTDTHP